MGGVLAIDLGAKKTGFAYADPLGIVVRPLDVVRINEEEDALLDHVEGLVNERDVALLLLGIPLREGDRPSARQDAVKEFQVRLELRFPTLEIELRDERLTTKEAETLLYEAGFRGKDANRRKDSWAALVILRDYLGH